MARSPTAREIRRQLISTLENLKAPATLKEVLQHLPKEWRCQDEKLPDTYHDREEVVTLVMASLAALHHERRVRYTAVKWEIGVELVR